MPGAVVLAESAVGMQRAWIAETLRRWCDEEELDLVLTIGGTWPAPGPSSSQCVPEATQEVLDRLAPGLSEAMRADAQVDPVLALLDRGVAGIRSSTLIVNLPEGETAALFFGVIAEVVPAFVARLQGLGVAPDHPEPETSAGESGSRKPLDAGEFAAFLKRRKD